MIFHIPHANRLLWAAEREACHMQIVLSPTRRIEVRAKVFGLDHFLFARHLVLVLMCTGCLMIMETEHRQWGPVLSRIQAVFYPKYHRKHLRVTWPAHVVS
eukprot:TRINITY_DN13505_c0_g1_i1.p4 TRINITY_DN13505_c0_g1~~TRINITY_DN13505_c0_g1_i1.p4  ORF type:complete len:101 (-),score=1.85 TRINITY_DN13505_c0_g1_i1:2349-2651(-)